MGTGQLKQIRMFTDGAARGNPGRGGYGVVLLNRSHRRELSAGFERTTNNRMELMAVIAGLESLRFPCEVEVFSDSKYIINAMNQNWIAGWKARGWQRQRSQLLKNADLWKLLDRARAPHQMTWTWVKGHAGHRENERCDQLATAVADSGDLDVDGGFIKALNAGKIQEDLEFGD